MARLGHEHPVTLDCIFSFSLPVMRVGSILIILGAGLIVLGLLVRFAPGLFSWFGHLPGDVLIEGENSRVFIPVTSMVVVSIAFSVVASLVGWFFRSR